ncbi:serine/threonine protein kinase, partial [Mangrovicoccus sp. HB182678]|nr:serine/threonine protein kinase [Mangrovicoccus algicola]
LVAAGLGGWFGGVFDRMPQLPLADPYLLEVERAAGGPPRATGHVPSRALADAFAARLAEAGGSAELTLARGDLPGDWGAGMLDLLERALPLQDFRMTAAGAEVHVTGRAATPAEQAIRQAAFDAGFPAGLTGTAEIALTPQILPPADLRAALAELADCGPLRLVDPPAAGYAAGAEIAVAGDLEGPDSLRRLRDGLAPLIRDRPLRLDMAVLNPPLCRVAAELPAPGGTPLRIRMGWGGRDAENTAGLYHVGENPVIDLDLPADPAEGRLWVSIIDVEGVVFHLLPNRMRPENDVTALRDEAGPEGLRLAWPAAEAADGSRIAFTVDDSVLGKSLILALRTRGPLFEELRPVSESAESFAEALNRARAEGRMADLQQGRAILTTAP